MKNTQKKAPGKKVERKKEKKVRPTVRLWGYFKPYTAILAGGIICVVITTLSTLAVPWIIGKNLIDTVIMEKNLSLLNKIAILLLLLFTVRGFVSYLQTYFLSRVSYGVTTDLRNSAYEHLQGLSLGFYRRKRAGEIISRLTNDMNVIQTNLINELSSFFENFLTVAGVGIFIFYIHWRLSLLVLGIIPFLGFIINKFSVWIRKASHSVQRKMADISSILQETLVGIEVIKSFATEEREVEKFKEENIKNLKLNIKRALISAALSPVVEILTLAGLVFILWYGAREIIRGALTIGELVSFLGYVALVVNPISKISKSWGKYQQVVASAERVFEIMDEEPEIKEPPGAFVIPKIKGHVAFENVWFSYNEGEIILKNINLEVKPGEKIALVGPTGVGKTTLVSLIPRFYDPTSGRVRIDGHDVKTLNLSSLRSQIGIVPQETILFSGTIKDNIAYSKPDATEKEIIEAAKRANAHEFIINLKDGYNTYVGERGVTLSGGEKQRIAIARAILKNPRILILDEATSAVDAHSELLIKEALKSLMEEKTTFIIAHRLSTIKGVTKVVVLYKGEIKEIGSHGELLAKDGIYAKLYKMQAGQMEP